MVLMASSFCYCVVHNLQAGAEYGDVKLFTNSVLYAPIHCIHVVEVFRTPLLLMLQKKVF